MHERKQKASDLTAGAGGKVVPIVALAMAVFLVSTVCVEAAYWRYETYLAQRVADRAAEAGAASLARSADLAAAVAAATLAGSAGRAHRSSDDAIVSFSFRPLHASQGRRRQTLGFVDVVIERRAPEFFSSADGPNYRTVSARAEAPL